MNHSLTAGWNISSTWRSLISHLSLGASGNILYGIIYGTINPIFGTILKAWKVPVNPRWLTEIRIPLKEESGTIYYNITRYEYDLAGRLLTEKRSDEYVTHTGEPSLWDTINYTYYGDSLVHMSGMSMTSGIQTGTL